MGEDECPCYINIIAFYIRDLITHGFWYPQVLKPISYRHQGLSIDIDIRISNDIAPIEAPQRECGGLCTILIT